MTRLLRGLSGLALLLILFAAAPVLAQPQARYPALSGRVTDAANVLPAQTEAELTQRLAALETSTGRQLVVATVPSLNGYEIEEYANGLFRAWRLGERTRNDGVLLLVAPNERKVRIEVGYGLEGVVTDALSSVIIREQIIPRFRAGDMPGGVVAGANVLITQLTADPEAAQRNVAQAADKSDGEGSIWPVIISFAIVWIMLWLFSGAFGGGRRRRRGSAADWVVPAIVFGSGSSGGGWGGGGGGWSGGGGGFSGGGGSSGGGGASGGW